MYIPEFWAGVAITLASEIVVLMILLIYVGHKNKDKEDRP